MSESMSAEWEIWLSQEKSNHEVIKRQLEEFSSYLESPGELQYRAFWDHAKETSEMIDTLSPLPEDERDEFRRTYDNIRKEAKKRQSEEWETRAMKSQQMRVSILKKVEEAFSHTEGALDNIHSLNKAQSLLSEALNLLKNGGERSSNDNPENSPSNNVLLRDDRQICWDKWREANDLVFNSKQTIWDEHHEKILPEAKSALEEANDGDPFQALDKVKETQQHLKKDPLGKIQRDELRSILNEAWEIAIAKVNAIREDKKRSYEEWLERMENQIEEWTSQHRTNSEESTKLQEDLETIKDKIQSARSKDIGDKLREQIAEKRDQIKNFERINRQLEEKIQTVKTKLDE